MKLNANESIEWPGDEAIVRTSGASPGTVSISHTARDGSGHLQPASRRLVAQLSVGDERRINLPPGLVSYDACNGMGQAIDVEVTLEAAAKGEKVPTTEQRLRALERGAA